MPEQTLKKLGVGDQDLAKLSFCPSNQASLASWVEGLPHTNVGETSKALFTASNELPRLKVEPEELLNMLDTVLPAVMQTSTGLSTYYLDQPVVLSSKSQLIVDLSHTMWCNMANGYTRVAFALTSSRAGLLRRPNKSLISKAITRAITLLKEDLVICYQLYITPPKYVWLKLHQLYRLASELNIHKVASLDEEFQNSGSIRDLYSQTLMLGCIRANQLRQSDVSLVSKMLPMWTNKVNISPLEENIPALFVVNPGTDRSPIYSRLIAPEKIKQFSLQVDTTELAEYFRLLGASSDGQGAEIGGRHLSQDLINHLVLAWGKTSKRSFMRMESDAILEVCFGIDAAHFHANGSVPIKQMIEEAQKKSGSASVSAQVFQINSPARTETVEEPGEAEPDYGEDVETIDYDSLLPKGLIEQPKDNFVTTKVGVNNASPGGYSISISSELGQEVHAGDLIAVREEGTEHWSIAAVSWMHRPNKADLTFGVELLSPAYTPSVARVVSANTTPEEFKTVLVLPEISVTNQPKSLLSESHSLEVGAVLQILDRDELANIKITDVLLKTRKYTHYAYELFDAANDSDDDNFSELWKEL